SARSEPFLGSSNSSADFFSRTLDQRLAEHHRRADRRFYFSGVLSMAARSASEYDWTFPRRFYRCGGTAILLLKQSWGSATSRESSRPITFHSVQGELATLRTHRRFTHSISG